MSPRRSIYICADSRLAVVSRSRTVEAVRMSWPEALSRCVIALALAFVAWRFFRASTK
jgi:hypothetical protein